MRLIPDSVAGRTLAVLVIGLAVSHALSMAIYMTDRSSALILTGGEHVGERIATVARLVASAPPKERDRIIELARNATLHVTRTKRSWIEDAARENWETGVLRRAMAAHLPGGSRQDFRMRYASSPGLVGPWHKHYETVLSNPDESRIIFVSLPIGSGEWLNFAAPIEDPDPMLTYRFVLSMAVMLGAVLILSMIIIHHLNKPLRIFAEAAQRLGVDVDAPPLRESGPLEVRRATRAFNEMQERIRRFVQDRTQMLAAVSHDLRTPITRLRLRAEFVEDEEQREKMLADLDEMERMVKSTLAFARDDAADEAHSALDLAALLHSLCDDLADAGQDVVCSAEGSVAYAGRPSALRRAFANLIENAVTYGARARVSVEADDEEIVVAVEDEGPGLPAEERERAFQPFYRVEASRSRESGGTGLGLTVARNIVRGHGGDILLRRRDDGPGLRAEVHLPR